MALRPSGRLHGLPRYGKGRASQAGAYIHRLGSNEAPDGSSRLPPAVEDVLNHVNRYPDLRGETLAAALATRYALQSDQVAVGAGSIVLLEQLIRAFCDQGDEIVAPWRSYEAYPILAGISGARLVHVPLDSNYRMDPERIVASIGPRGRMVILCNPNNPTGTVLSEDVIDGLLDAMPRDVLVVLDEAYVEYSLSPTALLTSPGRRLARHPNLAVLRTFSKAWGLAGLRAGYCMASADIVEALNAVAPPFPLSSVTLAATTALLDCSERLLARIKQNETERNRLTAGLRQAQIPVSDSRANFVWLPVGQSATLLAGHFAQASIAVRCFDGEGIRITTGAAADTDAVLSSVAAWR